MRPASPSGGTAQAQCWWGPRHGGAPAPPLLDCHTLHNLLHQKQSEPGRSVQRWVVFSIVISNFLPFVGWMVMCAIGIKLLQISLLVHSFCKIWNLVIVEIGHVVEWEIWGATGWRKKKLYINLCVCINYSKALTYKIFTNARNLCIKSLWNTAFWIQIAVIKKENTSKPEYDIDKIYFNYIDKHEMPMSFRKAVQAWN